jgi:hypothetical protein
MYSSLEYTSFPNAFFLSLHNLLVLVHTYCRCKYTVAKLVNTTHKFIFLAICSIFTTIKLVSNKSCRFLWWDLYFTLCTNFYFVQEELPCIHAFQTPKFTKLHWVGWIQFLHYVFLLYISCTENRMIKDLTDEIMKYNVTWGCMGPTASLDMRVMRKIPLIIYCQIFYYSLL